MWHKLCMRYLFISIYSPRLLNAGNILLVCLSKIGLNTESIDKGEMQTGDWVSG